MDKLLNVPVTYKIDSFENDDRFKRIRVYVMHDKLNLNDSYFSMNSIEKAKPSIVNIPILAFVRQKDGEERKDFGGHEMEVSFDDENGLKIKYLGRPVGVIDANNNYHYEEIDGKNYVVVDGYIWTNYANDGLDILERDGEKSQSMEVVIDDGHFNEEEGYYEVTDYRYLGLCLLGDDVPPAMVGAKAQMFSANKEYTKMLDELKNFLESYSEKEGVSELFDEILEKFEITIEEACEKLEVENLDEFTAEELEQKLEEIFAESDDDNSDEEEDNSDEEEDNSEEEEDSDEEDVDEDYSKKISDLEGDLDKLKQDYQSLLDKHNDLIKEAEGLREFKSNALKLEHEANADKIFDSEAFSSLEEEDVKEIRENVHEYSLEQIESKCYEILGKKLAKFSKNQSDDSQDSIKVLFEKHSQDDSGLGYEGLMKKYLGK